MEILEARGRCQSWRMGHKYVFEGLCNQDVSP